MPTYGLYLSTLVHEFIGIYVRKLSKIFTINSEMIVKKLSEKQKRVIVDSLVNEFKTLFTNR